jgi:hypothetical protein
MHTNVWQENLMENDQLEDLKAHGVKQSHYTPWRRRGSGGIALLILYLGTRWGEWSASHPGRTLAPGKGPSVPNVQEARWAP